MHNKKQSIAMLLAGGQGSRLRVLTKNLAKPAVPFGGQYRIIDFSLSNCVNSGIDTVGVLTQYKPQLLNSYVGIGTSWDLLCQNGGLSILPPYIGEDGGSWYKGTAHAVYQNMSFIEKHRPENVLILSGDHIYKMDYSKMLEYHQAKKASITIAVVEVPRDEASRFGIMSTNEDGRIIEFEEKPQDPKSNLASMGVYVFNTECLKSYLEKDVRDPESVNDFGKNVIPRMLREKERMYAYAFGGYWKDVGTIESYWKASMDILDDKTPLNIFDKNWGIYSLNSSLPPQYVASTARIKNAMIAEGCLISGEVENSIVFPGAVMEKGSRVKDSVIMSNVKISGNVKIEKAIIGENTEVGEGSIIGGEFSAEEYSAASSKVDPKITVVEDNLQLAPHTRIGLLLRLKRIDSRLSEVAEV